MHTLHPYYLHRRTDLRLDDRRAVGVRLLVVAEEGLEVQAPTDERLELIHVALGNESGLELNKRKGTVAEERTSAE